jgi:DNA-binding transcriptional MocR family regulator
MRKLNSFKLQRLVRRDARLMPLSVRICGELIDLWNPNTGYAWPSVATLARTLGCASRSVKRCLRQLEQFGYIVTRRGGGRGKASEYVPVEPDPERVTEPSPHNPTVSSIRRADARETLVNGYARRLAARLFGGRLDSAWEHMMNNQETLPPEVRLSLC